MAYFPFYLGLVLVILLLMMLAKKLRIAYPVLLVLAGLFISFIPFVPQLHIDPELIFIIFLPPLLYEAAWAISWKELWRWRRIISSFAFVVVFITALTVAVISNHFIPGFSLALGFLLGGIVSPPDAVSAGAILKFVKIPKRMSSILEGESLLNDASSLIIFRFALIAVATGQFIWQDAALNFGWMLAGGIGIGLLIGLLFMKLHKYLPTDANTDIIFTLITPYVIYIAAEELHSSGVLAVVAGGLFLSNKRYTFLSSSSRLRGSNFWESLSFLLNGIVFMLIGLDLPEIIAGLGSVSILDATLYGLLITVVLIISRLIAAYGALIVTLIARNFIKVADTRNPGLKVPFVLGWSGMRGVVSLAAALSIPVYLPGGAAFPHRDLILFVTFVVILLTLLLQGLSLPYLIRKFNLPDVDQDTSEEEIEAGLRKKMAQLGLEYINGQCPERLKAQPALRQIAAKWRQGEDLEHTNAMTVEVKQVYQEILNRQREWLLEKNSSEAGLNEDLIRKQLQYLDLEEERLGYI
ncbi:Na+/H+ antiporter [Mucilaginibacter rubeus]|uniref:Na+/H+ antiporter n=1 Tax=Mucilaginibacter rubeus TaxID=2027860 RepID=A0AAE6ML36_9SPHI|nr:MULTISPECIES: Na+/H+ antiporter [Mucilaginibacter]QEM07159.1 Na+/H+ antiporter [Mucilaginibacter rubeus]QEM19613.1 Na+/H+ antiporter [Mucilaginibacter gossypii]QTE43696.1 Na+/H+ antiporter [Mucilaginibacter rubeus]QTE50296.1 Na+/H+ antiporter [Mucilaginibacter rubeus]QTE55383.1 Na+/H+ antiporter [Mucilaginibacter rubeus]